MLLSSERKPEEKKRILEKDFDIPMTAEMSEEANVMCNLGEGIRERAELKAQAKIIARIMMKKHISFEEAVATIFATDEEIEELKVFVDELLAVSA